MNILSNREKMEFVRNRDLVFIFSQNQSGKTTLVKNIIENIDKNKVIVLDTQNSFKDYPIRTFTIRHDYKILDKFIEISRKYYNMTLVFDDVDVYQPNKSKNFYDLLVSNAHQNIGIIITARRVLWFPKISLSNAKYLIFSAFIPIEDKEYLKRSGIDINWEEVDKLPRFSFYCYNQYDRTAEILRTHL